MKTYALSIILLASIAGIIGCSKNKVREKGFRISQTEPRQVNTNTQSIHKDSIVLETRPSNVLLTSMPEYRLTTIYKVNYNKDKTSFIGSNSHHTNYDEISYTRGNQWHNNYLPGFEVISGYNMVNVGHHNTKALVQKKFFEKPVLIKTLYYPAFSKDTLNYQPVTRDYYMLSVYDEDTNKDGKISMADLRRFYYFDKDATNQTALVPKNYSVYKSEYDPANDYFYLFAYLDENNNGQYDQPESTHVYWVDLKNPEKKGQLY